MMTNNCSCGCNNNYNINYEKIATSMQTKISLADPKAIVPKYATSCSAGADIFARIDEEITVWPGTRALIPTKIKIAIPDGCCGLLLGRSGLALKYGICLANGVGLIDSDYRGELGVILQNNGGEPFKVKDGMRIAQLVIVQYQQTRFKQDSLDDTIRGQGGFGSTGV
jgi:dUTP pyrophosphatase|nr:MAG TPA: dUTPase [Caudoviricetes sp.]